ncbi:hypothetical protein Tco_0744900 [Tanacetum coccineum]
MSSSTVTYTSVYTDSEPWRFQWVSDDELEAPDAAPLSTQKDTYDDLFDYLQQFEKLVNASRAKKLEKSLYPLALVAGMSSSSRSTSPYYVTYPSSVVDYDDDYQGDALQNNFEDPLTSPLTCSLKIQDIYMFKKKSLKVNVQNDAGNIQRTLQATSSGSATNDEVGVTLTDEQNDFLVADATRMEEIEELSC